MTILLVITAVRVYFCTRKLLKETKIEETIGYFDHWCNFIWGPAPSLATPMGIDSTKTRISIFKFLFFFFERTTPKSQLSKHDCLAN